MSKAFREAQAMFAKAKDQAKLLNPRTDYKAKNDAILEAGYHPATGTKLFPELGTCGECKHCIRRQYGGSYLKCELHRLGMSHSEASDIRAKWPACRYFQKEGA
jgi:hypothetical protein